MKILVRQHYLISLDDLDYEMALDYERKKSHEWTVRKINNGYYACMPQGILLHREIMKPLPGFCIDHINQNTLDNQRSNLRVTSYSVNRLNSKINSNNKTGERNITLTGDVYRVMFRRNKHTLHAGSFKTLEEAIKVRDFKLKELNGLS